MSDENLEIVQEAFDAFNASFRGELTGRAAAELLDPQIEFQWRDKQTVPPDVPQHLCGAVEIIGLWEQFRGVWADLTWEALEFIEAGDRVLTPIRQPSRGRESGIPMEVHVFVVWTIRDGKVRKVELFRHRAEALKAAGLSE
jgi:ketosteroid isomerase-like protein